MTFDIKTLKRLGYNMLRKHVKVEPALYYAAADELGILIMQDMPCLRPSRGPNDEHHAEFERQVEVLVKQLKSYTSIFAWVSIPNMQTSIFSLGSKVGRLKPPLTLSRIEA
jgi:beta-galactosidase/beta-glucuronidase